MGNEETKPEGTETEAPDYKALWEAAQADAEKWKALSRKNEQRAKGNAGAVKDLEEANSQLADLTRRLEAIESENASLKAERERAAIVSRVAEATGVPEAIVASLAGTDEQALIDTANAIADAYRVPGGAPSAPEAGRFPRDSSGTEGNQELFGRLVSDALKA